jgi:hypothetical protein
VSEESPCHLFDRGFRAMLPFKRHILSLVVTLVLSTLPAPIAGAAKDDSIFMMVLGDSVTLGVWADVPLGHPDPRFYGELFGIQLQASLLELLTGEKVDDLSNAKKYAALVDRNFSYLTRRQWSGLIGTKSYSLPRLIETETGKRVEVMTAAILAGCYQLGSLLYDKIEDFYKTHPLHKDPDLVVINFNAMDFIFATPQDEFEQYVKILFQRLAARFPHSTFVVTPLADVVSLMTESFRLTTIPGGFGLPSLRCYESYQKVGFGGMIHLNPSTPPHAIEELKETWNAMQSALDRELELWSSQRDDDNPYALFTGHVIKTERVSPPDGTWAPFLAIDCIHPNSKGQKLLGTVVWSALKDQGGISLLQPHPFSE